MHPVHGLRHLIAFKDHGGNVQSYPQFNEILRKISQNFWQKMDKLILASKWNFKKFQRVRAILRKKKIRGQQSPV